MEIDRKSPDCRSFLSALMNLLEEVTVHAYCYCCKVSEVTSIYMVGIVELCDYARA